MQAVKFIKSFSRGQITIPKDIREKLGVPEEFWMKIFVDNGKIIVEPVHNGSASSQQSEHLYGEKKLTKDEYLKILSSVNTDWFSKKDEEDYKKIRKEFEEHVKTNSL